LPPAGGKSKSKRQGVRGCARAGGGHPPQLRSHGRSTTSHVVNSSAMYLPPSIARSQALAAPLAPLQRPLVLAPLPLALLCAGSSWGAPTGLAQPTCAPSEGRHGKKMEGKGKTTCICNSNSAPKKNKPSRSDRQPPPLLIESTNAPGIVPKGRRQTERQRI
jgi:hypothetical protein